MKKLCGLLAFVVLTSALCASITEVVVYPQGALVREEQALKIKKGVSEIAWGELGQTSDEGSVRVELPEGARLLDRRIEVQNIAQERNLEREELQKKLQQAEDTLKGQNDRLTLLSQRDEYVSQIQSASTTPVRGETAYNFPTQEQWAGLLNFVGTERTKVLQERREGEAARAETQKLVESLRRQLAQLQSAPTLLVKKLVLEIEALRDLTGNVAVLYFDNAAAWRPTYQVWADPIKDRISLSYGALVRQGSAANWQDVALTLSTARPRQGTTPPELPVWWVRERQDYPRPMAARAGGLLKGVQLARASDAAMEMNMSESETLAFAPTAVSQNLTFAEFKLPNRVSLPADSQEHRFVVTEVPLTGELLYKIVPEFAREAYLLAKIKNSSEFTLLAGETQLYVSGSFVGRGMLAMTQPEETFDLNLGVDPAVKIERKELARKTEKTGLLNDNTKVTFEYSIELTNLKPSAQKVELQERVPLSQHEKIKVVLIEPKDLKPDKEGKLTWTFELQPREKKTLALKYTIEHPDKMEVDGI